LQGDLFDHRWPMTGTRANPSANDSAVSPTGKGVKAVPSSRIMMRPLLGTDAPPLTPSAGGANHSQICADLAQLSEQWFGKPPVFGFETRGMASLDCSCWCATLGNLCSPETLRLDDADEGASLGVCEEQWFRSYADPQERSGLLDVVLARQDHCGFRAHGPLDHCSVWGGFSGQISL
jgi:hypothetical protein